jgi:flagellar hook-associated protein 1 FlgK
MGILDVGITGLRVAQLGLQTTSHNIANSSTPGFSRQEIKQTTNQPNLTGYGYFGQGAQVTTVNRIFSEYLSTQSLGAEANVAELDSYLAQAQQIDNLLADPTAGLSPSMSSFFQAVQQMAADPSSVPARQSMLSSSQALVARFQGLDQRLAEIRDGVNTQIKSEVVTINAFANQLAQLNSRIVQAIAVSQDNPPNDLYDQRDELVRDLNKQIRASAVAQSDGSVNIFIANGQPLVVGALSYQLSAGGISSEDPERISISLRSPSGVLTNVPESQFQGGALGGLLNFRSQTLDPAQNGLGRVAYAVASNFNVQHRLGIDLQGEFGKDMFGLGQPTVLSNANNTGTAKLTAAIINSDYLIDGAAGTVIRLSDGIDVTPAGGVTTFPIQIDGITITNTSGGTPGPADKFIIKPGALPNQRVIPYTDNTGDAVLDSTPSNIQSLPAIATDYRVSVLANGIQMVRLSDNKSWFGADYDALTAQLDADPQGFVLSVNDPTAFGIGDTFLIQPTRQAAKYLTVNLSDPVKIAAAAPFRTQASLNNNGTGKIDLGSVISADPAGVPLAQSVQITVLYDQPTDTYSLLFTGGIDTTVSPFKPGQPNEINLAGMRFSISGVPAAGDTFQIERNNNGVADNRNAIALGALQTQGMLNGGSTTFAASYGQIVSFVGNKTREVEVTGKAQQTLANQAETARQTLSGVNLDEEAANLMRYQQAYQAAAKVMSIAGRLFDDLLQLGG